MTNAIHDFNSKILTKYSFCYNQTQSLENVIDNFCSQMDTDIDVNELVSEYHHIFSVYYNRSMYIENIKAKFASMLNRKN